MLNTNKEQLIRLKKSSRQREPLVQQIFTLLGSYLFLRNHNVEFRLKRFSQHGDIIWEIRSEMKESKELVRSESSAPFIVISLDKLVFFQLPLVLGLQCGSSSTPLVKHAHRGIIHFYVLFIHVYCSLTCICPLHPATPLDCEVSLWSSWGLCLGPCSRGGVRHRTRYILLRPANSGTPCPELEEQAECVPHSCMKLQ